MEQQRRKVITLSRSETADLQDGVSFIHRSENQKFIIFKDSDEFTACKNVCKHQGGSFAVDMEDMTNCTLKCSRHGWKLDPSTMCYINPPDSFKQDNLVTEMEDGCLTLTELTPKQPWETNRRNPEPIELEEVKVTYFAHACLKLKFGNVVMFTDPWLTGPAFARSWWLLHEPPADWLDQLSSADLIYISHLHPDHLSYPTLKCLSERNPNIPIYVGDTSMPVFCKLGRSGVKLNNINILKIGSWHEVNKDLRFMIMMDGVHPEMDTCLLVDYKGHLVLNTVDCASPNARSLPTNIDLLLSDFAGGATCYPLCFSGGSYTENWKREYVKFERNKLLYYKCQVIKEVNPKVFCPIAGYFLEAHPADKYIKENNFRNNPVALNAFINKHCPEVNTWTPLPGATLDLAKAITNQSDYVTNPPPGTKIFKDSWNFDLYVNNVNKNYDNEIFAYPDWIQFYYNWIGFSNYNLVLRVIETDDNFELIEGGYEFLVDFNENNPAYPTSRPARKHNFLEVKNRMGVHRETVVHGLFWDNLASFNNRLYREPDIFHFVFWNHMQILLKKDPPDWNKFLKEQRVKEAMKKAIWKPSGGIKALAGSSSKFGNIPYRGFPTAHRYIALLQYYKRVIIMPAILIGVLLLAYGI
ncbi:cytidine monophosphate-N-acetylneuraminic acid hydroxylase-like [Antedon mediterranea]|uniref:cytidine monophosphate-N-acetylneuraminic acid hydroxylase-like n=1 Tax=Antedon mediterranea TaxID=105859 RepID=UPI003AF446E5